jgi:hypothetical protein
MSWRSSPPSWRFTLGVAGSLIYSALMQNNPPKKRGRPTSGKSRRVIAAVNQVSERSLYYSQQIFRSGRGDLIGAVQRGEMTIAAAIRELTGARLPDRYDKLVLAWNRCDDEERRRFLDELASLGLVTLDSSD